MFRPIGARSLFNAAEEQCACCLQAHDDKENPVTTSLTDNNSTSDYDLYRYERLAPFHTYDGECQFSNNEAPVEGKDYEYPREPKDPKDVDLNDPNKE